MLQFHMYKKHRAS